VRTVARHGNVVILGRSGYAILSGLADVLHVRLQAPLEERIERTSGEQKISLEAAAALVKEKDRIRKAFVESFYHVPWEASQAFDIVINTAIVPLELATNWVIAAAKLRKVKPGDKATTKLIEIDPVMMLTVGEKLNCPTEHA
jgi:cytidylate kinase